MSGLINTVVSRFVLIAVLLSGATACSNIQLGYNFADSFSLYYLDSYLDLTPQQEQQASRGLQELFAWHRQHELPAYVSELGRAQQFVVTQLTVEDLQGINEFLRASLERTSLQATPMLAELMLSLTPAQVAHLRRELDTSNAEFRAENLAGTALEQRTRRYELMLSQFDQWFGGLDAQQLALLRVANADWPVDNQFWYTERLIRQQEVLALIDVAVQQKPTHTQMVEQLQQYIRGYEQNRPQQRQALIDGSRAHAMQLVVAVAGAGSAEQKANAVARAQSLIDDFSVLLAQR